MGISTRSDICEFVAHIDESSLPSYDYGEPAKGWNWCWEAADTGKKNNLLSSTFVKVVDDKFMAVHLINDDFHNCAICAVKEEETEQLLKDNKETIENDDDSMIMHGFDFRDKVFGGKKESVELFLQDFGIEEDIEDMDSISQTM